MKNRVDAAEVWIPVQFNSVLRLGWPEGIPKKRAAVGGEIGARNKMPYYFTVLRDLLGMKKGSGAHDAG